MNDHELEQLMRLAAADLRRVPEPPLDRMWGAIEARAFGPRVLPLPRRPWLRPLAFAATLLLGVALGWGSARWGQAPAGGGGAAPAPAGVAAAAAPPSPFVGVASDYLEQTTALIVTVAGGDSLATLTPAAVRRARQLLSTTRLLLDAGVESPALRDLLQDVELVLAQLVRIPESRPAGDAHFVNEAVAQRDLLPRLTLLLADARGDH